MPSHWTVVQYIPDPIADERVNIGVVGYSEGVIETRFLSNWQRVKLLFGKDAVDLKRVEAIFQDIDESRLLEMIDGWKNSLQFTTPTTSLRSLVDAVDEAARRFLVDPPLTERTTRSHSDVVGFARNELSAAVARRFSARAARGLVRSNMPIPGRFGVNRKFDIGVRNGKPVHAIQALSFAGSQSPDRRVEATAFLVEEVREKVPVTVVVAPPVAQALHMTYENARKTLTALHAQVVTEDEFALEAVGKILEELGMHRSGFTPGS